MPGENPPAQQVFLAHLHKRALGAVTAAQVTCHTMIAADDRWRWWFA